MIRLVALVFCSAALFTLPIGCGSASSRDTTPTAFSFAQRMDAPLSVYIVSDAAIIDGINAPAPIHISGGEYSLDGGLFTSIDGTVSSGQSVRVRHTTASSPGITTTTEITIGGVVASFVSTTGAVVADTAPEPFSFPLAIGVPLGVVVTSSPVTITGINTAAPVAVVGGEYSIDGGPFASTPGMISAGETIQVRHTSAASPSTTVVTSLSVGGVTGSFTSTTAGDSIPDPFSFAPQSGVPVSTIVESEAVVLSGLSAPARITVMGGEYSIDGGTYTSSAGYVSAGASVRVRHQSAADYSTTTTTTLAIGGISATFLSVTAGADVPPVDAVPDRFSFDPRIGVPLDSLVVSDPVTVSGMNAAAKIRISGGEYSIDGAEFTSSPGMVTEGQIIRVRHTSASAPGTLVTTTLTIGGISGTFASMT